MGTGPSPGRTAILAAVLAGSAALGLSGCSRSGFLIRNLTDETNTVRVVDPSVSLEVVVEPSDLGGTGAGADGCLDRAVAAYDSSGSEIARLERGACSGRVWAIEQDRAYLEN